MATARDDIPYMPSLPLSFKYENTKWSQMDVTRWDLVEAGGSAHRSPPCGSQCSGSCALGQMLKEKGERICHSDGQAEWISAWEKLSMGDLSATLTFVDTFCCAFKFIRRSKQVLAELGDGKTRSWQQRRDDHQPPLRTLLSAGRGIQRAPQWRGVPQAVHPRSLQRGQAAEDGERRGGSNWRSSEEAPA